MHRQGIDFERKTEKLGSKDVRLYADISESACDTLWYHLLIKSLTGSTYKNTHESKTKHRERQSVCI